MNQDKQERLKACLKELATLLYEEADIAIRSEVKSDRMSTECSLRII